MDRKRHKKKERKQQKNTVNIQCPPRPTGLSNSDKRRRRNNESSDSDDHEESAQDDPVAPVIYKRDLYWGPKDRPTHFLAVRLTDPTLLTSVQTIYQQILSIEPNYIDCLIPVERLHLTLGNIRLAESQVSSRANSSELDQSCSRSSTGVDVSQAYSRSSTDVNEPHSEPQHSPLLDVNQARAILSRLGVELAQSASQLSIKLDGFSEFFNSTIYAKLVDENGLLQKWVELLHARLKEEGIVFAEVFDFTPHVTLLKITRSMAVKLRTSYFDGRIMPMLHGVTIAGEQKLSEYGIQLCEKASQFGPDGFYITPFCISLALT